MSDNLLLVNRRRLCRRVLCSGNRSWSTGTAAAAVLDQNELRANWACKAPAASGGHRGSCTEHSHHRRYAHSFVASTSLYRQHHCLPRGWRSASYTTSVRPSVAPAHASVPRDGGLQPALCLDEPRIAQRGGLCRHGGELSGCGAARRAISAQVRARARYGFYRFWRVCGFSAQPHTAFFEPVSHSGMDRCAKDATCEGPEQIDLAALAGDLLQNCSRHFGRPTDLPLLVVIVRLRRR